LFDAWWAFALARSAIGVAVVDDANSRRLVRFVYREARGIGVVTAARLRSARVHPVNIVLLFSYYVSLRSDQLDVHMRCRFQKKGFADSGYVKAVGGFMSA
jgi:hypothetical protein